MATRLRTCRLCGGFYPRRARWCPACYDDDGRRKPLNLHLSSAPQLRIGQRVRYIGSGSSSWMALDGTVGQVLAVDRDMATYRPDGWPVPVGDWPQGVMTTARSLAPVEETGD